MGERNSESNSGSTSYDILPIVYICSPFSGEIEHNQENARRYCRFAVKQGYIPLAPHLLFPQFLDDTDPAEREIAMRMNMVLLSQCAELWVFGDRVSEGMTMEINEARRRGQPIRYFSIEMASSEIR